MSTADLLAMVVTGAVLSSAVGIAFVVGVRYGVYRLTYEINSNLERRKKEQA